MHSALFKGALAIVLVTAAAAAHGASVTIQNGTNIITSEQSGPPGAGTLSIEKSHGRTVLHQRNGGNSVDFSVSGSGNDVREGDASESDTPDTAAQARDDDTPDASDEPVRAAPRSKAERDREAIDFVRRHASPAERANLDRLLDRMGMAYDR